MSEHRTNTLEFLSTSANFLMIARTIINKTKKNQRRWWVKPHISRPMREKFGAYEKCFKYFKNQDIEEFLKYTRMEPSQFDILHEMVKGKLKKYSIRKPLPTELRLALTIT